MKIQMHLIVRYALLILFLSLSNLLAAQTSVAPTSAIDAEVKVHKHGLFSGRRTKKASRATENAGHSLRKQKKLNRRAKGKRDERTFVTQKSATENNTRRRKR